MSQPPPRGGRGGRGGRGRGGGRGQSPHAGDGSQGSPRQGAEGGGRQAPRLQGPSGNAPNAPRGGHGGHSGPPALRTQGRTPTISQNLTTGELDSLIKSFRTMQVAEGDMPLRPGWGTQGKPITLLSNFFALRVPDDFTIYDYEVSISPDDLRGPGKTRIFELLEGSTECAPYMGHVAHDRSKRLVSSKKLPLPLRIRIPFVEEGVPPPSGGPPVYTVDIKFQRAHGWTDISP